MTDVCRDRSRIQNLRVHMFLALKQRLRSKLIQCTSSFLIEANEVSDGLSTPPVEPNSRFHRRTLQQRVKDFRHLLSLKTTMLWSAMDLQHVACGFAPRDVLKPTVPTVFAGAKRGVLVVTLRVLAWNDQDAPQVHGQSQSLPQQVKLRANARICMVVFHIPHLAAVCWMLMFPNGFLRKSRSIQDFPFHWRYAIRARCHNVPGIARHIPTADQQRLVLRKVRAAAIAARELVLVDVVLHFLGLRRIHGPSGSAHITSGFLICDWVKLPKLCKHFFGADRWFVRDLPGCPRLQKCSEPDGGACSQQWKTCQNTQHSPILACLLTSHGCRTPWVLVSGARIVETWGGEPPGLVTLVKMSPILKVDKKRPHVV